MVDDRLSKTETPIYKGVGPLTKAEIRFYEETVASIRGTLDWHDGLGDPIRRRIYFERCLVRAFRAGREFERRLGDLPGVSQPGCGCETEDYVCDDCQKATEEKGAD